MSEDIVQIDPFKVCCGRRQSEHNGVICPDGKVMCCICFRRFDPSSLFTYPGNDVPSNVCVPCGERDVEQMKQIARQLPEPRAH